MAPSRAFFALLAVAAPALSAPALAAPASQPAQLRSGVIVSDDYPTSALREGAEGTSVLRFLVGADGRVARCEVVESSGNMALDATACALLQRRFRYRPALDAAGAPVEEWQTFRQVWTLPEPPAGEFGKPASD